MASSRSRGAGNTPKDDAWLKWMEEHGGLSPIDVEAEDIPFPAKVIWDGDAANNGSPWMVPPPGRRCNGSAYVRDPDGDYVLDRNGTRITRPCWNWPMKGMTVCLKHGGGITRVRKAAIERMAAGLDAASGELVRLALGARDEKVRLGSITALMDRLGVRSGIDLHSVEDPEYLTILRNIFEKSGHTDPEETDGAD